MIIVENWIIEANKHERQVHLDLNEPCIIRGGVSTNHKGVLAQFLNTNIPNGTKNKIHLCHACHNSKCSNPKHLYWGTQKENIEDSISNGTHFKSYNGHSQTPETREKISKAFKGVKKSEEHKAKISKAMLEKYSGMR